MSREQRKQNTYLGCCDPPASFQKMHAMKAVSSNSPFLELACIFEHQCCVFELDAWEIFIKVETLYCYP